MPSLLGVRPLLLIAAPMTIAILENEKIGLGFGVFAGLLMDMVMSTHSSMHSSQMAAPDPVTSLRT